MGKDDGERMADELRLMRIADIRSDAKARIAIRRDEAKSSRLPRRAR